MIERIGLVNFLEAVGIDPTRTWSSPRTNPTFAPTAGTTRSRIAMNKVRLRRNRETWPPMRTPIESGVPDNRPFLQPALLKNYGNWRTTTGRGPACCTTSRTAATRCGRCAPARSGRWTCHHPQAVRHRRPLRRRPCPLHHPQQHRVHGRRGPGQGRAADSRTHAAGFPVGGTGNSVSMISHTQGWLHCDIPAPTPRAR